MKVSFAAVLFLSAIVQGAVVAGECVWKGAGWARFDKKENWQGGKVPSAEDMIKPASMLLDLGGGKAVVAGMKPSGWEALYDLGISNGVLSVAKHYASRSNLVRIERDGVLSFETGSLWLGGSNMGNDRWEKVSVLSGGRMEVKGAFCPWHATIDIASGGILTLSPKTADFANSAFASAIVNRGRLEIPSELRWTASGRAGSSFSIVQKEGTLKIGGAIRGFQSDSTERSGVLSLSVEGGRIEASGHVAFVDFASCSVAPGAKVELYVADGGSFDLSPFSIGKGAKIVKKGAGTVVIGAGGMPAALVVEEGATSTVPFLQKNARPVFTIPDQSRFTYEPSTPRIDGGCAKGMKSGLRGRNAGLVRIDGSNALGNESAKSWRAVAWRNESVHGQFVAWSKNGADRLRASVSALETADGHMLPASAARTRFVRYVVGHATYKGKLTHPERLFGDCLDDVQQLYLPPFGYRPVWLTVNVPADAQPGVYRGKLTVRANAHDKLEFPLELTVRSRTLPPPSQWKTYLDLWQHPWAVARYHCVKPFSKMHYGFMEMYLKELASLGQKVITATVVDRPWGQSNNYDLFGSMVEAVRRRDGSWTFDYSVFDEYVEFAKRCGLGPQIHCYTLAGFKTSFTDESTGEKLLSLKGRNETEDYWKRFLRDFERHVREKGWLGDVYIALDESSPETLRKAERFLRSNAPGIKLAMAGERNPSEYTGVTIDNFSLHISHVSPSFLNEVKARRAGGMTTSYYICCGPNSPNTFLRSPLCESAWQGVYIAATGIDGLLRWAAFTWPRDPLFDGSFNHWAPGDTYLIYPGPRTSTRWEMLREGLETAEKIRILRAEGKVSAQLEELLNPASFKNGSEFYEKRTAAVFAAVDAVE